MGIRMKRPRRAAKAGAADLPRYRVPQHWQRQLGGTLGDQLAHLHQVLSDRDRQIRVARDDPRMQSTWRAVRAHGAMTVARLAELMTWSMAAARRNLEQAVGLGLLQKQDRRDARGRRVIYLEALS